MDEQYPLVLITGVTGYLGAAIASAFLSSGFRVRGTTRSLESDSARNIRTLLPAIELIAADVTDSEQMKNGIVSGVEYVIHTASPVPALGSSPEDAQEKIVDPAIKGTNFVLAAMDEELKKEGCKLKGLVFTSSGAAVIEHFPKDNTKIWSEEDWNTTSTVKDGAYRLGKTMAERAVWSWGETHPNMRVIVICPSLVFGPPIMARSDSTSVKIIKEMLDGTTKKKGGVQPNCYATIDVRDVAKAHVAAIQTDAKGRYIVSSKKGIPFLEIAKILKQQFPDYPIPDTQLGEINYTGGNLPSTSGYNNEKAITQFKIQYIPLEVSLKDMVNKMKELGVIQ